MTFTLTISFAGVSLLLLIHAQNQTVDYSAILRIIRVAIAQLQINLRVESGTINILSLEFNRVDTVVYNYNKPVTITISLYYPIILAIRIVQVN